MLAVTVGAISTMTLEVMTRASLGHQPDPYRQGRNRDPDRRHEKSEDLRQIFRLGLRPRTKAQRRDQSPRGTPEMRPHSASNAS